MMLGYAWQCGLVPVGRKAILQSIEMNAVAVAANTDAFNWGRVLAQDPAQVERVANPAKARRLDQMSTEDIIAHRAAHLRAYQDQALADRYRSALERIARAADPARVGQNDLLRQVAITYARVLAYKDEYEVARLYAAPEFHLSLEAAFEGKLRIAFNLAPPMLPGKTSDGRPKKREFGPWILPLFRALARMKGLRGTWADPFGYSHDRKLERGLIAFYEQDLALAVQWLSTQTLLQFRALLTLPGEIRGYGPVKEAAYHQQMARRQSLRAAIEIGGAPAIAAE